MQALIDFDGWRAWKKLGEQQAAKQSEMEAKETEEQRLKREKKEEKRLEMLRKMGKS